MNRIYSATYSNVPVYEFNVEGNHVMRRRADDYINATHILKVAAYDKPARTRILEREVQKGTHEKVQGGYGKYQGTWVPLSDGRDLAQRTNCLDKLLPIFEYVPGDRSPPPAPKHATAASNKARASNHSSQPRRAAAATQRQSQMSEVSFDNYSQGYVEDQTPDNASIATDSEAGMMPASQYSVGSRKRKRDVEPEPLISTEDQQHLLWSDELLDYFMLQRTDENLPVAPEPGSAIDINRPVDEKGHTPLHWAAAMGDMSMVKKLVGRGANLSAKTNSGETPLMHAIAFTNNYDKQSMSLLTAILHSTAGQKDWYGSTVLHHISASTCSKSKYRTARYYFLSVLEKLSELYDAHQVRQLLDQQDSSGDTALFLAAKYGARKCVRVLIDFGARADIENQQGHTAVDLIEKLNARRQGRHRGASSSPVQASDGRANAFNASEGQSLQTKQTSLSYISDAANIITSQLPGLVNSRAEALAAALDQELTERQQEANESARLLEQRRKEIEALQTQSASLAAREEAEQVIESKRSELDALVSESIALIQSEQAAFLAHRLQQEEAKQRQQQQQQANHDQNASDADDVNERVQLARQLAELQAVRVELITEVSKAQSLAGHGERHEAYKRLVTGALGLKGNDVEAMLPDILAELEEAKDDNEDGFGDEAHLARFGENINGRIGAPSQAVH